MAPKATAAAKSAEQTARATNAPANNQLATSSADDFDFDFGATGLEGADDADRKTPALVFNLKGKDEQGRMRQLDEYLITDDESVHKEVTCIFLAFTKTNSFRTFNDAEKKNDTICQSYDRKVATLRKQHSQLPSMPVGTQRHCENCIDKQWYRDEKGKNRRNCSEFSNVFAVMVSDERDEDGKIPPSALGREFMVRFGKTSLPPFVDHLNKHHFKKHPKLRGKDVPLFAYAVKLTLSVDDGGNYAVPVISLAGNCRRDTNEGLAELTRSFLEIREDFMRAAERNEERAESGVIDAHGESSDGGGGGRRDEFADDGQA